MAGVSVSLPFPTSIDEDWEQRLAEGPVSASYMSDRRWNDQWLTVSSAALERENDRRKQTLARLKRIDRSVLTPVDQMNYPFRVGSLFYIIPGLTPMATGYRRVAATKKPHSILGRPLREQAIRLWSYFFDNPSR